MRNLLSKCFAAGQYAYLGRPQVILFYGCGLGDDVLLTGVAHELKKRGVGKLVVLSKFPSLFANSPDVSGVHAFGHPAMSRLKHWGYNCITPFYGRYDSVTDRDIAPQAHYLETMCRVAGMSGEIDLRTYFYLRAEEKEKGCLFPAQGVIHSAGRDAMRNKQWKPERYQAVADDLRKDIRWIQLGLAQDPPIAGALDLRGRTTLRESAAIMANSKIFLGEAGFLMHLARVVDTRAVIVYGGREDPAVSGYSANENVVGRTVCSPCWQRTRCDFGHECMRMIEPVEVIAAVRRQLDRAGEPLETGRVNLDAAMDKLA